MFYKVSTLLFLLLCLGLYANAQQSFSYTHDGLERSYILYLPDELPDQVPLVVVLHGYYSNAEQIMGYSEFNQLADQNGFAVCYPQGSKDYNGATHWNAQLGISDTNDIGFLTELTRYLQSAYNLDESRTFVCGHSNGGFMSYTLACETQGVFRAIASMAGTMSGYSWENRSLVNPIPVLQIHGVDDQTVPIDGSIAWEGWAGAPHMDTVIRFWAEVNQCSDIRQEFFPNETMAYYFSGGIAGNEVWYYKINNWGHPWPRTSNASHTGTNAGEVIWSFFERMGSVSSSANDHSVLPDFIIYPNPSSGVMFIEQSEPGTKDFRIFSFSGEVVRRGQISGYRFEIDLSDVAGGLYWLQVGQSYKALVKVF